MALLELKFTHYFKKGYYQGGKRCVCFVNPAGPWVAGVLRQIVSTATCADYANGYISGRFGLTERDITSSIEIWISGNKSHVIFENK